MRQCSKSMPAVGSVRPRGPHRQQQPSLHASLPSNGFHIHILHSQEPWTAVGGVVAFAAVVAVFLLLLRYFRCVCLKRQPSPKQKKVY